MSRKLIGYGVQWNGPDTYPLTRTRKVKGVLTEVPNSNGGRPAHHTERFRVTQLKAAKRLFEKQQKAEGVTHVKLQKITLLDDVPGFPMALWSDIDSEI